MIRQQHWLLMGAMAFGIGFSSAHGADEKKKATEPAKAALSSEPVFISGTPTRDGGQPRPIQCRDGDCTPRPMAGAYATQPGGRVHGQQMGGAGGAKQGHPPFGSYLDRLGRWFFYRAPETPCECKGHLPAYQPPLIAWFPCKPGDCATPRAAYARPITVAPRPDAPPPLPPTPQITKIERPLGVSGSSAAMADKQLPVKQPRRVNKTKAGSSVDFRRTSSYADGILPSNPNVIEARWEKAPR